ncbi:MAG TPA: tetratricopeptide repeat protein [Allosphingosinicella sp.]|uniref:tetratricopeptide repeat protein n=1 Tax=Allosphingosinicella sp. TaxID=2823234 RepID=UPI002ED84CC0
MAIKPKDNEAFYREVDEELRKEQLTSWWTRYGKLAIAGIVLLLAAIGGAIWWQEQRQAKAGERSEQILKTFDDVQAGRTKGVEARLDTIAKEGSDGHRAAALMTKAAVFVQNNNQGAAIAAYKQVAEDGDLPEPYRNAALIRQTQLEYDRLPPQQVIQRLQPLAQAGNPWFGTAGEMVAIAYLKANQPQRAAPIFAAIAKEQGVPETTRSRAVQMAGALGVDAVVEAPAAEAAPGAAKEAN